VVRIAYLAGSVIPSRSANSVHVMKMCAAFAAHGHEVTLYAPSRRTEEEPAPGGPHAFYGVAETFAVRKMPWLPVPGRAQLRAWLTALSLRRDRPDLVYGRDVIACAAAAALGHRTILESHIPAWQARGRIPAYFRRLAHSPNLVRLVVISNALKRLYREQGYLDDERIIVAHDGADEVGDIRPGPDWPGRKDAMQAGYAGQLHEGKGIELIAALAPLLPDVDFHVVGGRPVDVDAWKERSTAGNLHFHGFVPHAEVAGRIARFDICLLPNQRVVMPHGHGSGRANISEYTSPLKLFEYMAQGKCILASDLPVLREVLNESNAVLAPPDDVEAWRAAIDRLRDPVTRRCLAEAAHADFIAGYTWKQRAAAVLAAGDGGAWKGNTA